MEKFTFLCEEGNEALRDDIIRFIKENYTTEVIIVPGVTKRPS